jgi:Kef-type K+ transport system membrane component KefB
MLLIFGLLMYLIAKKGESYQTGVFASAPNSPENLHDGLHVFSDLLVNHIQSPLGILLLQIIVILFCCRIFSRLFELIKQPLVLGEIFAGILLGPSILGNWFPQLSAFLFPPDSMENISLLSQFGLILFMFVIGMELDIDQVRKKLKETILISHTSMIIPFSLGMLVAYFLYGKYANESTSFLSFALFIGIAMSITAFPVLARIIQEKGLTKSHLGTISLASAANGDITALCLLAVVVAVAQAGSILSAVYNIAATALYIVIMFLVVRPFLRMIGQVYHNEEVINRTLVAFIFFILIASAFLTEILGLHTIFGAFMAGIAMPPDIKFRKIMTEKVEGVALSLFLPLFFVSIGLSTNFGLLNTPELWQLFGIFVLLSFIGKFGGVTLAAKVVGENWKNSLYTGALMNTHGLMDLVVLSIGYQMHILPPSIFAIMVLMTLFITFMVSPLMSGIKAVFRMREKLTEQKKREHSEGVFKVLLSFGRAGNGQVMLNVADLMFSKGDNKLEITALHFTRGTEVNPIQTDIFEMVSFTPILEEARKLGIHIETRYEISNNVGQDITTIANEGGYDFLLVGAGIIWSNLPNDIAASRFRSVKGRRFIPEAWFFPNELLQDKTKMFIEQTNCSVGVFVNRDFVNAEKIILILDSSDDLFLLPFAQALHKSTNGSIAILDRSKPDIPGKDVMTQAIKQFRETVKPAKILPEKDISARLLDEFDFMLIAYSTWNDVSEFRKEALQQMPSTLIISK